MKKQFGGAKIADIDHRTYEIEKHLHNNEKWFGAAAVPSGETHVADRVAGGIAPFALESGNDDFNAVWTQVLGGGDTPVEAGMEKFDLHRILVSGTDSTAVFVVQIVRGESAGIAAKIAAEDFTEFMYISSSNNNDSGISDVIDDRGNDGDKVWMRCCCIGQNAKTINLYHGLHEYTE